MSHKLDYQRPGSYDARVYARIKVWLGITAIIGFVVSGVGYLQDDSTVSFVGRGLAGIGTSAMLLMQYFQRKHEKACDTEEDYEREYRARRKAREGWRQEAGRDAGKD